MPGRSGIETPVPGQTCFEMCPRFWEVLFQGSKQVNNTQDREVDPTLPGCMLTIINVSWPWSRNKLTGSLGWRTCTQWLSLGAWASQNTACNEMETPPSQCFWRTRATQPTLLWSFHLLIQRYPRKQILQLLCQMDRAGSDTSRFPIKADFLQAIRRWMFKVQIALRSRCLDTDPSRNWCLGICAGPDSLVSRLGSKMLTAEEGFWSSWTCYLDSILVFCINGLYCCSKQTPVCSEWW